MILADEASRDARMAREYRDVLLSNVGNLLRAAGKKSVVMHGLKAEIVTDKVLWCVCHKSDAILCENALAGKDIGVEIQYAERTFVKALKP